jgi:hypothetical protein
VLSVDRKSLAVVLFMLRNGCSVPCRSLSCLQGCVNLFRALVKWRAMAIDRLRLTICWNHQVDGVAV